MIWAEPLSEITLSSVSTLTEAVQDIHMDQRELWKASGTPSVLLRSIRIRWKTTSILMVFLKVFSNTNKTKLTQDVLIDPKNSSNFIRKSICPPQIHQDEIEDYLNLDGVLEGFQQCLQNKTYSGRPYWPQYIIKLHQEPHLSSTDPSGWDGGLPQSWWGSWRFTAMLTKQNLLRTSILTPEYHQTSSGTPSVLLRSIRIRWRTTSVLMGFLKVFSITYKTKLAQDILFDPTKSSNFIRNPICPPTHRWTKFKWTNFLIDTLFAPSLKTPHGHSYNWSCA